MKNRYLFLLALVLVVLAVLPFLRTRPASIPWNSSSQAAFEQAHQNTQEILVYLYTDWCGYCRRMNQTTFTDAQLINEMGDRFVWLKLNAETDSDGLEMQRRFQVTGYPTILVLDSNGREIDRIPGFVGPERFVQTVQDIVVSEESFGRIRENAELAPDEVHLQYELAEKYLERRLYGQARDQFLKVISLDPLQQNPLTESSLYYVAICSMRLQQNDDVRGALHDLERAFPAGRYEPETLLLRAQLLYADGKKKGAHRLLAQFLDDYPDHASVPRVKQLLASEGWKKTALASN